MAYGTFPDWLGYLSLAWIVLGVLCALTIVADEFRHPQKMWVMNIVGPVTALFGTFMWVGAYCAWGRNVAAGAKGNTKPPFAAMVMKGTCHCGAGCALGDLIAEWAAFAFPAVAVWFGWHTRPATRGRTKSRRWSIRRRTQPARKASSPFAAPSSAARKLELHQ